MFTRINMKKIPFLVILLLLFNSFILPPSAISRSYVDEFLEMETGLAIFNNERGDISVRYPKDWFTKIYKYNNPYSIFFSREKVENPDDIFGTGITILKFYHQSWYLDFDPNDSERAIHSLVDSYFAVLKDLNKKIIKKKIVLADGTVAVKGEITFQLEGFHDIKLFIVCAMKGDTMVQILTEAPHDEFENYRDIFDEVISTAMIFYPGNETDNVLLDKETESFLMNDIIKEGSNKDFSQVFDYYEKLIKMNPDYAKTHFAAGGFFFQVAMRFNDERRAGVAKIAEKFFNSSIDLYLEHNDNYNKFDRAINISQAYYLLGDIYYFFYEEKEKAEGFYKQSLSHFEHPDARRKLEKYFDVTP